MAKTHSLVTVVNRAATPDDALNFVVHSTPDEFRRAVRNRKIPVNRLYAMALDAAAAPLPTDTAATLVEKIISALRPVAMYSPLAPHVAWKE